jgi:cellobiose phosphorylase
MFSYIKFEGYIEFMAGTYSYYDGFTVNPCRPSIWLSIHVKRPLRGKIYDINVCRSGNSYNIKINGMDYNPGDKIAYN